MHELSIAESILEAVEAELDQRPGARALKVGVRIGPMAAVDAGSLQFCFDSVVRDSEWEPLRLEIILAPLRRLCAKCGQLFDLKEYEVKCPVCGSEESLIAGGDELDLEYLELDEPEPESVAVGEAAETGNWKWEEIDETHAVES